MNVYARQTWALLVDSYRELNYKKLFWITLILSVLVVVAFAGAGINEKGVTILKWEFETPFMNTAVMSKETFYKTYLVSLGVGVWLGWIATALALISTASIFPDFLTSGAVDLWLSRPISRVRLFVTKYIFGLLFVTLQVGAFALACFIVIGIRAGAWEPAIFLAVPLVVAFFSYLYAFCVLFGVLTRSTIAALLLTLLVWFGFFLVNSTETTLMAVRTMQQVHAEGVEKRLKRREDDAAKAGVESRPERVQQLKDELAEARTTVEKLDWWHGWSYRAKTVLPKTDETKELLSRSLVSLADLPDVPELSDLDDSMPGGPGMRPRDPADRRSFEQRMDEQRIAQRRIQTEIRERSVWWVLGTSLLFEAGVVGIAAMIFCRRDF